MKKKGSIFSLSSPCRNFKHYFRLVARREILFYAWTQQKIIDVEFVAIFKFHLYAFISSTKQNKQTIAFILRDSDDKIAV